MWAVIVFALSLTLLSAFIAFRLWEEYRGVRLYGEAREHADQRVSMVYEHLVTRDIPVEWRMRLLQFFHFASHRLVVIAVETLRAIERPLARLSYRLRTRVPKANGQEVSPFLKTMSVERKNEQEGNGTTPAPTPREGRGSDLSDVSESVGKV